MTRERTSPPTDWTRERLGPNADPLRLVGEIFERLPQPVQVLQADGRLLLVNQAYRDLFTGEPPADVLGGAPTRFIAAVRRALGGDDVPATSFVYDRAQARVVDAMGGDCIAVEAKFVPLPTESGAIEHVAVMYEDARPKLERAALERRHFEHAALALAVGDALTRGDRSAPTLDRCAAAFVEHLGAARARIWIADEKGESLVLHASAGTTAASEPSTRSIATDDSEIAHVARTRTPYLTNAAAADPKKSDREWVIREKVVAFAGYPLLVEDRLVGVMAVSARSQFSDDTFDALAAVSDTLAIGIERRQSADERARLFEDAKRERARAEDANRLKDEFLTTLSHELRTPLTAILGWIQMLRTGQLKPDRIQRALETIERNTRAQARLVEDVLDISRIVSGKLFVHLRPIELGAVVQAALDTARPAAEAKQIRLRAALDDRAMVTGDPDRLQQVIWNLLANAVKFTPEGGAVDIGLRPVESHAEVVVRDSGSGIESSFLPHVFERFRQGDGTMTRTHGGLGVGLSIVKSLVELHGGTVEVESPGPGAGATFTVRIPLAHAD